MANLFSGLEEFGLGNLSEMDVYETKEKDNAKGPEEADKDAFSEEDIIFDKTYT